MQYSKEDVNTFLVDLEFPNEDDGRCVVPKYRPFEVARGHPLPMYDGDITVLNECCPNPHDFIDFDSIPSSWFERTLSPQPLYGQEKIFGFDSDGNKIEERRPPIMLKYVFAGNSLSEKDAIKKLFEYQSRKQSKVKIEQQKIAKITVNTSKRQTVETLYDNIKKHPAEWFEEEATTKDKPRPVKRERRKVLEGSYPNFTVKDENKLPALLRYTWKGKIMKLKRHLEKKNAGDFQINMQDEFGNRCALHLAASWGDDEIVQLLLKVSDIDVNLKDRLKMTPLFKAVQIQSLACVKLLVGAGADSTISCCDTRNALQYAVMEFGDEAYDVIEFLYYRTLEANQNKVWVETHSQQQEKKMSLLHFACITQGAHKTVDFLIKCGVNVNATEGNGRTPLILAAIYQINETVMCLLKNNAAVNIQDKFERKAIQYAEKDSE